MSTFGAFYMLPVFAMVFYFSLICLALFIPAIYFLAPAPNRIISTIVSWKLHGAALLMIIVALGMFLHDVLGSVGLSEGTFIADMDQLRWETILLLVGLKILFLLRYFAKKTVLDTEKDEKKDPVLFGSQVFHGYLVGFYAVAGVMLNFLVLDYLLSFVFFDEGAQRQDFLLFIVNVAALLTPLLFGLYIIKPSLFNKMRFLPKIKSPSAALFHIIAILGTTLGFLLSLGIIVRTLLVLAIDRPAVLGTVNNDDLRVQLTFFLVIFATRAFFCFRSGGRKAFYNK